MHPVQCDPSDIFLSSTDQSTSPFLFLLLSLKKSFGCGMNSDQDKEAYVVMRQEYRKLGPMKFAEGAVLFIFVLLVLLWFTREPGFIDGWATVLFNKEDA